MTATNSPVQRIADGTAAVQETIAPEVQIEVTTAESICFAMECAAIPIVMDLKITNLSTGAFLSVEVGVTLQPGLGAEQRVPIASLQPGGTVSLPVLDFRLDPGWLRSVVEREPSELVIRVLSHGRELSRVERRVEVLAYNEWPGLRAPASLLASFVMPNEPCIALLLGVVGDILLRTTRDPAIVAYQSKSLGRARAEVAALYDCVSQFGLRYVGVPPSFEDAGQKVRLVETVLSNKLANCLDVALLFASALEAMNFAPLVILLDTHAFCGVWLEDDRFSEGEVEDSARLRTLAQLGSLLLFDGTAALSGRTFADAQALATHHLSSEERFRTALDIRVLRRARYLPLPIRRDRHLDAVARYPVNPVLPNRDDPQHSREQAEPLRAAPETVTQSRFRKWKESLLDLTLRNRLLNFRLTGKSVLRLDVPDVELFEDLLAADRPLQMLSRPAESALRSPELLLRRDADAAEVRKALREDLSKALIYSAEPETELWERAITLDRAARKDLEEGGAATLFVAIGLLRWYESSSSEEARLAPLLLYPVKLEFDRRSRRLTLRREADDPVVNQTLIEKMRLDFKVDLSALARLEADEPGVNVDSLLRCARQAVQQVPRWEVLSEAHIALFSFAKFLMWKDLDENAEQLLKSAVVKRIAEGTCVEGAVTAETVDLRSLDANVSPAELPCVLDLDGTQLAAVATALDGASFVLQGPPGTGKSQTITTLIAAALARGKTVLFVSEKMAALDVVHRRLRNVGLSDFCLELHSHKTNKKDVIASFNAVLERQRGPADNGKWKEACEELTGLRAELNDYVQALHQPTLLGASYYEVGSRLHELRGNPDVHVQSSTVRECSGQRFRALLQAVERFSGTAARVEPIAEHPWRASGRVKLEAAEERSLALLVTGAIAALRQLEDASQRIALHMGRVLTGCWEEVHGLCSAADALIQDLRLLDREWSSGPIAHAVHNAPAWSGLVDQANGYLACRGAIEHGASQLSNRWLDTFCEQDIERLATVFQQRSRSMFSWFYLRGARRSLLPSARGDLPGNAQITEDLLLAHHLTQLQRDLAGWEATLGSGFGDIWPSVSDSPPALLETLRRSERFRDACAALGKHPAAANVHISDVTSWRRTLAQLEHELSQLRAAADGWFAIEARLRAELQLDAAFWPTTSAPGGRSHVLGWLQYWAVHAEHLRPWCQYREGVATLEGMSIPGVPRAHSSGMRAAVLVSAFEASFLRCWRVAYLDTAPLLREFVGERHHLRVARFAALDEQHQTRSRERVVQLLEERAPSKDSARKGSEMDVLLRECKKKARHLPIRQLLKQTPLLRPKLKPCLLMSPLSVAQYLPADARFDLVVFDEASQIETHDAIGAIARGRQVVIVGDSKQLPPTSFFGRRHTEETPSNETDIEDLESILDEALAKGLPQLGLGWHYRSRHDSLISFSNEQYYGGRLQVFPAARRYVEDLGVTWHRTPSGGYQPGDGPSGRTNPSEAKALVSQLVSALKSHSPAERSFGVVTFSLTQAKLIEDLLERERTLNPEIERHFEGAEKMFVKNLENVQGDERDEILFSICYGPDSAGRVRHHFGPLSLSGGERRLNVAITRARKQLRVFSSMTHADIDLRKTRSVGAEHLRRFLEFASSQRQAQKEQAGNCRAFGSAVEREICEELSKAGYTVHTNVGVGQLQLDIAVVHPHEEGVYALAVEADGPAYRDVVVARDRDRLRGVVLRELLWKTYRVWSPDWLSRKSVEVERLLAATASATVRRVASPSAVAVESASSETDATTGPSQPLASQHASALVEPCAPLTPTAVAVHPLELQPATSGVRCYPSAKEYSLAALPTYSRVPEDFYGFAAVAQAREGLALLVDAEAPIHRDVAFRRLIGCWCWSKLGRRAQERLDGLLAGLAGERRLHVQDGFLWRSPTEPETYRDFRRGGPDGRARDPEHIPAHEFANALASVLCVALSAPEDELGRETARLLGAERVGARLAAALQTGVQRLIDRGVCLRNKERLSWVELPPEPRGDPESVESPSEVPSPSLHPTLEQLLAQRALCERVQRAGLSKPLLSAALALLLTQGGRASTVEFASALNVPEYRVAGLVARLAEVLNLDAYEVVRYSNETRAVELDRDLLRQAFSLTS